MHFMVARRALLSGCTALASTIGIAAGGYCTSASAAAAAAPGDTLQEVVVTAQRREQNVQDVPIAVTALTQASIAVNRVVTVNDLNLLAPGFAVARTVGGTQLPAFTIRGRTSYGVVPGSDKAISMYVDGFYLSSARGSIFDLPDVSQIEVLRGPQGTLFGRNATAGAVSITTRDPTGNLAFQQDFTVGNHAQFRSRTSIDAPAWNGLSGYVSFVHDEKQGDVKNLGAGTVWNYSNATTPDVPKTMTSPKYLGSENDNSVFVAVKYQPTDWFSSVYKFDYAENHGSPEAVVPLAVSPGLAGLVHLNPQIVLDSSGLRPNAVNNAFSTPRHQISQGHTLISKIETGNLTIKNIASYRESFLLTSDQLDGLGGLTVPIPPTFTTTLPITILGITNLTRSRQWSDELQSVYRSKLLTLTVGGLVFQVKDENGAMPGLPNNVAGLVGTHTIPSGLSTFYNKGQSIAAYAQAEFHVTSTLDFVGGIRETKDWKSGVDLLTPGPTPAQTAPSSFSYTANAPSYLIGVNYKPIEDVMLYVKYSTAFVSGGDVAGIAFAPETVASWEAGLKGEFFERRLRTNVAFYDATYQHLQTSQAGSTFTNPAWLLKYPWTPSLGTFIVDQGGQDHSRGVEFEGTLLVTHGVTTGANVSYDDTTYSNISPLASNPVPPVPVLLPKWTVGLWGNYEKTFGDGLKGAVRVDANWRDTIFFNNPTLASAAPFLASFITTHATWLVNGRAVLSGLKVGGVNAEIAVWGKNITDDRHPVYNLLLAPLDGTANFGPARSFGVDLHFKY